MYRCETDKASIAYQKHNYKKSVLPIIIVNELFAHNYNDANYCSFMCHLSQMSSHPQIVAVVGVGEMREGRATPAHSSLVYVGKLR